MTKRLGRLFLAGTIVALLVSCGIQDDDPAVEPPPGEPPPGAGGLSLSVDHPSPLRSGGPVTWALTVRNDGPAVTLEFGSGQDGEVVLAQEGVVRYRWSTDRAFTQALRRVPLGPGESRSFQLTGTLHVPAGAYDLVASVSSRPAPPQVEKTVTVAP